MNYRSDILQQYANLFDETHGVVKHALAVSPELQAKLLKSLAYGAVPAAAAAGTGGYFLGQGSGAEEAEAERKKTRNLAFGTGLAAGITAPHILRGLGQIARGASGTGLFPEINALGIGQY